MEDDDDDDDDDDDGDDEAVKVCPGREDADEKIAGSQPAATMGMELVRSLT